jgi:serine/threonine-protein kinase
MATVYLARDIKHERNVAVKVLRPELAAVLGTERFLNEIKITANLNHPNILPLLDSGVAGERPTAVPPYRRTAQDPSAFLYYVMPHVEGETLRDRINREKQLPIEDALKITEQVAGALEYAHRRDVIHRDIKPENILFHEGVAMVADFGIALAVKTAGGERLTETGLSLGTPAYMSPEQIAGERELDGRSDVYSLACVLYEMLAGDPPFVASTPQAVIARHMTDPAPPIATVRQGVPAPVVKTTAKALSKAPADRFGSANEFAEALFAESGGDEAEVKSIVVIPFANRSPDAENEYFSDGLTEELIADLSKIGALRVIAHSSAMQLKGTNKDARTIGRDVGVRYVLTGGVRKAGSQVRITAHLADTMDDSEVWTGKYGGELNDIFEMQENVSQAIVDALQVSLSPAEEQKLGVRIVADPRAYDCYLRARQDILLASKEGFERAIRLLKDALAIEGDNPLLLAMSGYAYTLYLKFRWAEDEDGARKEADRYLKKLQDLEPESPREHFVRGMIAVQRCEVRQAVRELEQSFIGDCNSPEVLVNLLNAYVIVGRDKASVTPLIDHLFTIDPLTPWNITLCSAFDAFEGRIQIALEAAIRAVEIDPSALWGVWAHSYFLALDGQTEEAAEVAERLRQMAPDWPWTNQLCAVIAALRGDFKKARSFITEHLIATAEEDNHASLHLAEPYSLLGMRDEAIAAIRNAIRLGFVHYPFFSKHNPFFESLREDPEFIELMGLAKKEWEYFGSFPVPEVG